MRNRSYHFCPIVISLAFTVVQGYAQSVYTPYTFSTIVGNSGYGSAEGTGNTARFYQPSGLAVDSAGNVYVADKLNHTIRKVTPEGMATPLAGLGGI
jgi:hypothetical protein